MVTHNKLDDAVHLEIGGKQMDVFSTYLNNIFAAYQETDQALRLKESLLMTMEEKYHDLILEGMSHDAAVGKVLGEFGTIEELADELVLKERFTQSDLTPKDEAMIEEYQLFMKDYSMKFAATIALLILPLIITIALSQWSGGVVAGIGFLVSAAIAIFFFLSLINQKEYYIKYFRSRELFHFLDPEEAEELLKNKASRPNRTTGLWSKIRNNIWLVAVAIYLVAGTFFNMWGTAWVIFPIATAILAFD